MSCLVGKEKGLEISKSLSLKMLELAEWQYYFGIFKKALEVAFCECKDYLSEYSKYIESQFWSDGLMANWKNFAAYDAELRSDARYGCIAD
ncbi:hypothetical protein DFH28DRAFT_994032 [Melampsora americana]|nr:hypothetical protein DFH28DRAFT_994032 [Melampsora americana]